MPIQINVNKQNIQKLINIFIQSMVKKHKKTHMIMSTCVCTQTQAHTHIHIGSHAHTMPIKNTHTHRAEKEMGERKKTRTLLKTSLKAGLEEL